MQVHKNLNYYYEKRYWSGIKCVRSFCKYNDMVKQLLLQNICGKKVVGTTIKSKKASCVFLPGNEVRILIHSFII